MTAARTAQIERKIRPAKSVPVQSRSCPKIWGPKYPPRLPMELMAAMPAAAPAPLRNAVGSVQNTGRAEKKPQLAMQTATILIIGLAVIEASPNPAAMAMKHDTACHLRSQVLSECHPQCTMPTADDVGYRSDKSRLNVRQAEIFHNLWQEKVNPII